MSDHPKERQIPAALIVAGIALYVLAAFVRAGPAGVGPALVGVLIGGAVQTVLLVVVALAVAASAGVSFGTPGSAALKFAAAALVSGGVAALIPYGGLVALFVFLGLVMWLFELELTYAVLLTVVYLAVSVGVALALRAASA